MVKIGQVAEATGVPVRTLRFWEQVGVLEEPPRLSSGYRNYRFETVDQVRFIRSAQAVGLPLEVIKGILRMRSHGITPCEHVEGLLRARLDEIDKRMESLKQARDEISALLIRARTLDPAECTDASVCHLISGRP